jgi:hypothetical protein
MQVPFAEDQHQVGVSSVIVMSRLIGDHPLSGDGYRLGGS